MTAAPSRLEGGRRSRGLRPASDLHNGQPLISVAIVTLNAGRTLEAAIASVLSQIGARFELVVIDGGSTDATLDIVRIHETEIDYWLSEQDSGIYNAMNKARLAASGDWLIFLGADDTLSNCLASAGRQFVAATTVYYGDVVLASDGRRYDGRFSRYKIMQQNICHQSIFYPRTAYKSQAYDETLRLLADHKYNIELIGRGFRFKYISLIICFFNDAGLSKMGEPQFYDQLLRLIRMNFGFGYFVLKWCRNMVVRFVKRAPNEPA